MGSNFWLTVRIKGHPLKTNYLDLPEMLKLTNWDVKRVNKAKSLGVVIDERLNWEEQFRCAKGKIIGGLAAPKRLTNVIPQSQLCNIYYALIESHLYAEVIWGSLSKTKIAGLQRLQDWACSITTSARIKDS